MRDIDLMIPGPVQVSSAVLQEMASPQVAHYSDEALSCYRECAELLAAVFGTRGNTTTHSPNPQRRVVLALPDQVARPEVIGL